MREFPIRVTAQFLGGCTLARSPSPVASTNHWLRSVLAGVISIGLLAGALSAQAETPFAGKRAILDGDIPLWTQKEYVDRTLLRIKEAGFNVYMPTVWQGRGTTWPSHYAPWDVELKHVPKTGFDPLRYVIEKAHELGIEVHPWFTLTLRQADIFPQFVLPDAREPAFNVHDPEFRALIVSLVEEVVTKYDVDGVNLDYVRAIDLCLTPVCQAEYKALYGKSLAVDSTLFKVGSALAPSLVEYQASAVTAMVEGIAKHVRRARPRAVISADVFVGHAPLNQGQVAVEWANKGLVDVLLRMDYYRRPNLASMAATKQELGNPDAQTFILSNMTLDDELGRGEKHYPREGTWLADTITDVNSRWPNTGIAVYFYKYLSDEQIDALRQGPFRTLSLKSSQGLQAH
jgi:uncharacterized lipoprotein YddW (UPF0748 family)